MSVPTRRPSRGGAAVAALAFACELAMLVVLVLAGVGLAGSTLSQVVLAILLPVTAAVTWSLWMAPTSGHRLPDPPRLVAQVVLFVVTGVLVALGGFVVLGVVFAVVAIVVFAAARRVDAPAVADEACRQL